MMQKTLKDFAIAKPLYCQHCELELRNSSPVSQFEKFFVVFCLLCSCSSVFKISDLEAA